MASVPTGTTFYVASTIASAKTTTVVTNASEAVVTSAAHGYSNGDFVLILSGWGRLNKRAFRIKSVTTDTFVLEGADTTSTTFYPAGTGIGTVQKISAWTQITQVLGISTSGGDPKNVDYKYIESDVSYSINDGFAASSASMDLDADSITTAGYIALKALTEVQTDTVVKQVKRSGAITLRPCTVALNEDESIADGQVNKVKAAMNGNNRLTRYAS
jgi:hypothetical protein